MIEMEFAIPILKFKPENVTWGLARSAPLRKTIPFGYDQEGISMTSLVIVLDPLKVVQLDMEKNQLTLEEFKGNSCLSVLERFQLNVNSELEKDYKKWFEETKVPAIVKSPLQTWVKSNRIALYLSSEPGALHFYDETGPVLFSEKTVKPGDIIQSVIKIQSLSLQLSEDDNWTGKSRIQHNILQLYKC
jgi:hypothetical protein